MKITDPISDMLTRIRNAIAVNKSDVVLPHSKFKENLANLLVANKRLEKSEVLEESGKKYLKLVIRYEATGLPAISGVKRVSKPGQRIYSRGREVPLVRISTNGMTIISTSKGLMTDEQARKENVGGEIICQIW